MELSSTPVRNMLQSDAVKGKVMEKMSLESQEGRCCPFVTTRPIRDVLGTHVAVIRRLVFSHLERSGKPSSSVSTDRAICHSQLKMTKVMNKKFRRKFR